MKHERSKVEIENGMEIAGLGEIANLEKNAKILSIIAHIATLLLVFWARCLDLSKPFQRNACNWVDGYLNHNRWPGYGVCFNHDSRRSCGRHFLQLWPTII